MEQGNNLMQQVESTQQQEKQRKLQQDELMKYLESRNGIMNHTPATAGYHSLDPISLPLKIYAKMSAILADTAFIGKDQDNKQQGFKFRGIDDVMNALHAVFAKHAVFLTVDLLESDRVEKPTKSGGLSLHHFNKYRFTFHADDGSSVSSVVVGESADSGDKGTNKCQSIALKYALLHMFLIPTKEDKDPDALSPEFVSPKAAPKKEAAVVAKAEAPSNVYTGADAQTLELKQILKKHKQLLIFADVSAAAIEQKVLLSELEAWFVANLESEDGETK